MLKYFGGTSDQPTNRFAELPVVVPSSDFHPKDYRASKELAAAVNVALILGKPLLLTGEPGCGKTELAKRIAWELGFPMDLYGRNFLKYAVKSTTEAKDLFYTYDYVGRFHAAQSNDLNIEISAAHFIDYQALGLAILRAKGRMGDFPSGVQSDSVKQSLPEQGQRSLVLIDEIDKASRDVPNDILNEIEYMEFSIPEMRGARIALNKDEAKPVVIITSNSERDLPSAFLRRCVYYHVPFPPFNADAFPEGKESAEGANDLVTVESIVISRMGHRFAEWNNLLADGLALSRFLRRDEQGLQKIPSLAETLDWMSFLADDVRTSSYTKPKSELNLQDLDRNNCILAIKTTMLKTQADQGRADTLFERFIELKQNLRNS